MALHDYAAEILGKANVHVLKALVRYRGKIFTIRELAKTANLSHPQASRVVKGLEKRGIVKLQPVGRALQVSLNEENYILKSVIEPLFAAEKDTINSLVSTIKPFFEHEKISSVAIFGSLAVGAERDGSDIDLLVVTKDRELANERAAEASAATLSRFGHALSPLILDEDRFIRNRDRELEKSILSHHTLVYGRNLKEIVNRGKISR